MGRCSKENGRCMIVERKEKLWRKICEEAAEGENIDVWIQKEREKLAKDAWVRSRSDGGSWPETQINYTKVEKKKNGG